MVLHTTIPAAISLSVLRMSRKFLTHTCRGRRGSFTRANRFLTPTFVIPQILANFFVSRSDARQRTSSTLYCASHDLLELHSKFEVSQIYSFLAHVGHWVLGRIPSIDEGLPCGAGFDTLFAAKRAQASVKTGSLQENLGLRIMKRANYIPILPR